MKNNSNKSLIRVIIAVGSLDLLTKLLIALKDIIAASKFGVSNDMDAFLIAYLIPLMVVTIFAGSLNVSLIPTFIAVREKEGAQAAQKLFSSITFISLIFMLIIVLILAFATPYILPLLASGFSPQKLEFTLSLFYLLLPITILSGVITIWSAILNAGERFVLAAISPALTPVVVIISIAVLGNRIGIHSMVAGSICGLSFEIFTLSTALKKQGFYLVPQWHGADRHVRTVISQYLPMIAGAFIMNGTMIVNQSMAAMLSPGTVSALNYGGKISSLVQSASSVALGTVMLPHFSRLVAERDWTGIRISLKHKTFWAGSIFIPITLMLIFLSDFSVSILFQRGQFKMEDVQSVSAINKVLLIQIPFCAISIIFVRLISSLNANRVLMFGAVLSLIINVSLNTILTPRIGVIGIAITTSVVYIVSFLFLGAMLQRLIRSQ